MRSQSWSRENGSVSKKEDQRNAPSGHREESTGTAGTPDLDHNDLARCHATDLVLETWA
ncbi:hypothetical protein RBSH_01178 [Rhodopirellula baltica SH28]|uniref:Uncharacterized protein n=1 Tax=Rhodopirellula baltica SH28 TaxID=993517 RepID=K5CHJ3_RHOBT|nr:hypothetical protein RBSH_01178 [Rhodopirellula baltica SH28]